MNCCSNTIFDRKILLRSDIGIIKIIYCFIFFQTFQIATDKEQKSLLYDCDVHCIEMYSGDEDSIISTPSASTVDIIKAAAKKWKNMDMNVKNRSESTRLNSSHP